MTLVLRFFSGQNSHAPGFCDKKKDQPVIIGNLFSIMIVSRSIGLAAPVDEKCQDRWNLPAGNPARARHETIH